MKKLLVYLKDYKKESILGPLFKLLEASFELLVPLVMAAIIDVGIADGDRGYVMKMCGVLQSIVLITLPENFLMYGINMFLFGLVFLLYFKDIQLILCKVIHRRGRR